MTLLILVLLILLLFGGWGFYGGPRYGVTYGWSPLLIVVVVLLVLYLTGYVHAEALT